MVTTTPKEPTIEAPDPPHYEPDMPMAFGSELRLNLKALGVDGSAPDFGERLVQLYSGQRTLRLSIFRPGRTDRNGPIRHFEQSRRDRNQRRTRNVEPANPGMCIFPRPSGSGFPAARS